MLSHQTTTIKLPKLTESIQSLATNNQHWLLFLCFQGLVLLISILLLIQTSKTYQSDLLEVTPDIKTPVPVGQFQHGSSRWLNNKEKDATFTSFTINPNNEEVKKLINNGYDKVDFLKKEGETKHEHL